MSSEFIIGLAGEAVYTTLKASAPMMVVALVIGLIISVFQATTQIQEATLAFVPKIVMVLVSILIFGPWILNTLVDFTYNLMNNLYKFVG
ncbi:flagellar biosynthesis protein FliQ [Paenibacillus validus]|uniref:Flagellar biosynthetic protein FliQ n=1 Tax=Paenibacillus validus TaxID=44253 RepID=A0A7X2Z8X0_9BACL|nr:MULTISPECIES: flagellar biosynthesis protein FliQ [Paenibacillus]MED4602695.1 flagellar biosynthesis protein FliQ [Paenibacillus validus]MED4607124.1 flagellar biosynthesis protein FliQ [Paenibacillus validus]MUG70515.1 flagellar biosynthesis protein FliQ [Paenibacillus validus]